MKAFCHIYAQWDQTRDRFAEEARHLLGLGLVADVAFGLSQAGRHRSALQEIADAGGLCAPNLYPADLDPAARDANWWKYSEEECAALLRRAAGKYADLGLGDFVAVNTYTPGNAFVAACRRVGVRYILGFCAPTVIEDGGWEIAHYGSPLTPFFVSEEDFRKPESSGREDSVLLSSMELRNPMVCLNHWSEGPWCPLNAQAADRWLEPSNDPLPFLQIAEDWLRQCELSGQSLFFHINLQYFFADRCFEHNRRALEWLAEQRDRGRLEIGGLRRWRERLAASGGFERQTSYWRGEMMGFHVGHRPGRYPDVVVDEGLDAQTIWQRPSLLPARRYDYGKPWSCPAFQPDGSAPSSEASSHLRVEYFEDRISPLEKRVGVAIQNDGPENEVPILLWDAFEDWLGPFQALDLPPGWRHRQVPHPSGQGGALLLEGRAAEGATRLEFTLRAGGCARGRLSRSWGGLVCAETFFWRDRPYTYLVSQTPEAFSVEVDISRASPAGAGITVERLCGHSYQAETVSDIPYTARFDGSRLACWHRLWGVTADQIELIGLEDVAERLDRGPHVAGATGAWGCQFFGNIRDTSRWDRQVAKLAGDAEMDRINSWFTALRPQAGERVIEVHPGIYLPRGSITKVLGHEFDLVRCQDGYGFQELCVDYPQGWDWGVAAWVQWRQLRVQLNGLRPERGEFFLHLHAFDPEGRGINQRVHLFDPTRSRGPCVAEGYPIYHPIELCAVPEWSLPQRLGGRWDASALCTIRIPESCLAWPALGLWISPLEKTRLYDWIEEHGAPGLFSHLWVTRKEI
ncbi:MAG: hypothetical protein BGO12_16320 [Verrucomicrobia bacterium 61-8]|nr:hypothetical protein [Verrucomicrobiota bacterium]OJU98808.1 MAG: hypothetical protein BGO12_16320 [Verrucomicrobia bacterium 61-8]